MGHLTWGDIVAILGSLASVFGGVRWLLAVYFKQQLRLDAARKTAFVSQLALLKNTIGDLEVKLSDYKHELEKLSERVEQMAEAFDGTKESAERVFKVLREYVTETRERFAKIENNQDPKQYNKVEVVDEKKQNVGKVIVKG